SYPVAVVEPHVRDIAIDPSNSKVIYAALQVGYMVKTTDGGLTWKLLNKQVDADVHTIRLNPRDPKNILVATGGHDFRLGKAPGKALYRSADGGESWQPAGAGLHQGASLPVERNPKDPDTAASGFATRTPGSRKRPPGAEGHVGH